MGDWVWREGDGWMDGGMEYELIIKYTMELN